MKKTFEFVSVYFTAMFNPFIAADALLRFNQFNAYKTLNQYNKIFVKSRKK